MQPARGGDILDDLLEDHLTIVFCGTRAGSASAQRGAYYAGPGNRFWPTLHAIGLTPHQLRPEAYAQLLTYRIGLTDLAKTTAGQDADMTPDDFDVQRFWGNIRRHAPAIVAFTSKTAAAVSLGMRTGALAYGRQMQRVAGAEIHVLPSTSGLATSYWNIAPWRDLATRARELGQHATA